MLLHLLTTCHNFISDLSLSCPKDTPNNTWPQPVIKGEKNTAIHHNCSHESGQVYENNVTVHCYLYWENKRLGNCSFAANVPKPPSGMVFYTAFPQHFGSDVTSASIVFNWSCECGATVAHTARRYAVMQTRNKRWFYVTSLPVLVEYVYTWLS